MGKTAAYEQELLSYLTERLSSISEIKIYGTSVEKEPVVSFSVEGRDVKKLGKIFK
jgi:cysteine desulfurase/selenocysteine lyase